MDCNILIALFGVLLDTVTINCAFNFLTPCITLILNSKYSLLSGFCFLLGFKHSASVLTLVRLRDREYSPLLCGIRRSHPYRGILVFLPYNSFRFACLAFFRSRLCVVVEPRSCSLKFVWTEFVLCFFVVDSFRCAHRVPSRSRLSLA